MSAASIAGGLPSERVPRARSTRPRLPRRLKRIALLLVALATIGVAAIAAINFYMTASTRGEITTTENARHAQAAIVLGALVNPDGSMSVMLADRVRRAAELYKAGKVDRVIVSGDHHRWTYDEPGAMRKALQASGVPAHDIFMDHAGFDTWATMRRAKSVFEVHSAIVVTQGFHMARSLYLADHAGLSAQGVTADYNLYGAQGRISSAREVAARVKGFLSATFRAPVLLGPVIPVTGDGRASWGPQRPPSK